MNIRVLLKGLVTKASDRSPEILTGLGIVGFVTAIIFAVRATPKAEEMLVSAEDEKGDSLTITEKLKATWKAYVPTAVTAVASGACLVGAARINHVRTAELATAYGISQAMLKRYDEKIAEVDGEEHAEDIKKAVNNSIQNESKVRESVSRLPAQNPAGLHPFWDPLSNTPFYANKDILDRAEVAMNKRLFSDGESYLNVNDMYDELNDAGVYPPLRHTALGPKFGWRAEDGGVQFSTLDKDEWDDGTPCYVLGFRLHHGPDTLYL